MKKVKNSKPKVFFNASVILAGLRSPGGGSGKVIGWAKNGKIDGVISEVIVDEIMCRCHKVDLTPRQAAGQITPFFNISPAPAAEAVEQYTRIVKDFGDRHVLAGAQENKCRYLVSLDKKHLLALRKKIKRFRILSPGQLIESLSK
ncbi:MAG: hypothetical protein UV54_C0035G0010 [Candidatus Beckwithbacteria bacterium GW2011_GWA2_43_10]|uniref:PIN domain-containing protein n=1 Tax=Candidatus Beckwithbacteria bacterium GW2011_GWA2_43_10 TaxID=1618369 RepID=A0A0G1C1P8_9BACT|nr:MAG: hypothetical protein UV54_C0035G0010 [Candidatus Beckwithbacteria bacterium GW2011_GWA2_43_10]